MVPAQNFKTNLDRAVVKPLEDFEKQITTDYKPSDENRASSSTQKQIHRDDHYDTEYKPQANKIVEIKQYDQKYGTKNPAASCGTLEKAIEQMMQLKQSIHWQANLEKQHTNHAQQQQQHWLKARRLSQQSMNCKTEEVADAAQKKKRMRKVKS